MLSTSALSAPPGARAQARGSTRRAAAQTSTWYSLPALVFLTAFFLVPLAFMARLSFFDPSFSLRHYAELFQTPVYLRVALNTFHLALGVTVICLVLGYPVATALSSTSPRLRRLLLIPIMLPYLTSLMVRTYAWMVLLGRQGVLNNILGVLGISPLPMMNNSFAVYVGMVHVLLPMMILPLLNSMRSIDGRVLQAASGLGATPWQRFWRVFLPLSMPGVLAGSGLVFIVALGFFITPALLGNLANSTFSMLIENQTGVALNWGLAAAMGFTLLLGTLVTLAAAMLAVRVAARAFGMTPMPLLGAKP